MSAGGPERNLVYSKGCSKKQNESVEVLHSTGRRKLRTQSESSRAIAWCDIERKDKGKRDWIESFQRPCIKRMGHGECALIVGR